MNIQLERHNKYQNNLGTTVIDYIAAFNRMNKAET